MTEDRDAYITSDIVSQAWKNWWNYHHGLNCEEVETRFFNYCHTLEQSFIDDPINWDIDDTETYHVAADTAHRIQQMAGPHFATVAAAYYVNHPWK